MSVKMPDAEVVLSGMVLAFAERLDFDTKALKGYRATVITTGGGAAIVNFDLTQPLPSAPLMSVCVWRVQSSNWAMGDNAGMTTKFLGLVDEAYLMGLASHLADLEAKYPDKSAK